MRRKRTGVALLLVFWVSALLAMLLALVLAGEHLVGNLFYRGRR